VPTIKQAQQPPVNMKNMLPVSSPALQPQSKPVPPVSIATESNLNSTAVGPIPAVLGTAYDSIKQWIRPANAPQYRIFPLPLKANSQIGSIVNSIIESQPTTPVTSVGNLSWKGDWLSFETYNQYDVVQFNISTYMALNTTTGVEPEGNPINWVLVSKNLNFRGTWMPVVSSYSLNASSENGGSGVSSGVTTFNPALPTWVASTGYVTGQKIVDSNGHLQTAIIGGVSGPGAHPTWSLFVGGETIDNTVTWVNGGSPDVISVGDLIYVQVTTHAPTTTGVTDSLGNTFTPVMNDSFFSQVSFDNFNMAVYQAFSTSALANGASYTITSTFSGVTTTWASRQLIFSGPNAGAAGVTTVSSFSTSPYMGNDFRAGPITPGPVVVPTNALVLFAAAHDHTTDFSTLPPSFTYFGPGALLDTAYALENMGTTNPFVLGLTSGAPQNIGWVASTFYFENPGSGGYEPFDLVLFNGDTYVCIADSILSPVDDPSSWALIATGLLSVVNDVNVTGSLVNGVLTLGWTGQLGLSRGGTNSDLSATGGTSQVLRQSSIGASVTVSQLAASDLTNGTTGTGAVVLAASPALTGAPTAPTPPFSDNSTKIATTAFVETAISSVPFGRHVISATTYTTLPSDIGNALDVQTASPTTITLANGVSSISFIAAVKADFTTTTALSLPALAGIVTGDLLVVSSQINSITNVETISDNLGGGQTWTKQFVQLGSAQQEVLWWAIANTSGTITVTISGPSALTGGALQQFRNTQPWTGVDQSANQNGTGTTPTITTTQARELIVAVFSSTANPMPGGFNAPFITDESIAFVGTVYNIVGHQIVSATGSYFATSVDATTALSGIVSFFGVSTNGFSGFVQNNGSSTVTLVPQSGLINGAASIVLAAGAGTTIATDNTNFTAII
jgi:hypothetical protein